MRITTLILIFCLLSLTAFGQTAKLHELTPTNAINNADEVVLNVAIVGTTNFVTLRVPWSNFVSTLNLGSASHSNATAFIATFSGTGSNTTLRTPFIPGSGATSNYVWSCTNATTGAGEWRASSGGGSSTGLVPIGAVIPWHKSLTNTIPALPSEFVECNGQTLSDAGSVFNGRVIPNLNGNNQFIRGNSTSGTTGGNLTHVHLFGGTTGIEDGDTDVQSDSGSPATVASLGHSHNFSGTTEAGDSLPPYMNMVWIMRIK